MIEMIFYSFSSLDKRQSFIFSEKKNKIKKQMKETNNNCFFPNCFSFLPTYKDHTDLPGHGYIGYAQVWVSTRNPSIVPYDRKCDT